MRYILKPGDTVQNYEIYAIYHDRQRSLMLGYNGYRYMVGTLTDESIESGDWDKSHFPRNERIADEMFSEMIASYFR